MKYMFVKLWGSKVRNIFLLGLVISPLIFWPWAGIPYELPRVFFIQRWIEILMILGLLEFTTINKKKGNIDTAIFYPVIIFALIAFLASIVGVDFGKSLVGNFYRGDGLLTLFHLVGFALFVMLFWRAEWRKLAVYSISIGVFIVSLWTLWDGGRLFLGGDETLNIWKDYSLGVSFGNPNFLAGYLIVTLPFVASLICGRYSFFWRLVLAIQVGAIFLTRSVAGLLGVLVFFALITIFYHLRFKKVLLLVFTISIALFGVLYIQNAQKIRLKSLVAEGRERIVRKTLLGVIKRPLLGYGWANVDYAFEASVWPYTLRSDVYVDKAHSMILEVLVTTGFLGLAFYLLILFRIGRKLYRWSFGDKEENHWYKTLLIVFLLYVIHSQTNIISIAEELIFWFIAGISASNDT